MADTRTRIVRTAERLIRAGGYNHCSFREIAAEIGIKSASVHHHFPTKQDLAVAVARHYTETFFRALGAPVVPGTPPADRIAHYAGRFRAAQQASGRACLCGILSSEAGLLPPQVQAEVGAFIDANVAWLEQALAASATGPGRPARRRARQIYAALQGAMAVAALKRDPRWLEDVAGSLAADPPASA